MSKLDVLSLVLGFAFIASYLNKDVIPWVFGFVAIAIFLIMMLYFLSELVLRRYFKRKHEFLGRVSKSEDIEEKGDERR